MIRSNAPIAVGTGNLRADIVELSAIAGYRVAMIGQITDADRRGVAPNLGANEHQGLGGGVCRIRRSRECAAFGIGASTNDGSMDRPSSFPGMR
jgi:hypothetical protein